MQDCTGAWGGDALIDECGVCDGTGTDDNSCCDDGLGPNGQEPDCAGECGGNSELDECGVCNGDGIAEGTCN